MSRLRNDLQEYDFNHKLQLLIEYAFNNGVDKIIEFAKYDTNIMQNSKSDIDKVINHWYCWCATNNDVDSILKYILDKTTIVEDNQDDIERIIENVFMLHYPNNMSRYLWELDKLDDPCGYGIHQHNMDYYNLTWRDLRNYSSSRPQPVVTSQPVVRSPPYPAVRSHPAVRTQPSVRSPHSPAVSTNSEVSTESQIPDQTVKQPEIDHIFEAEYKRLNEQCLKTLKNVAKNAEQCGICFDAKVDSCPNPCGHLNFCNGCITTWLKTNNKCPMCKTKIISIIKVYK